MFNFTHVFSLPIEPKETLTSILSQRPKTQPSTYSRLPVVKRILSFGIKLIVEFFSTVNNK